MIQRDIVEMLDDLPIGDRQLSLWGGDVEVGKIVAEVLDSVDGFQGEIKAFVGSIAIMKKEDGYYLFDFKRIVGRDFSIIPLI